MAANSDEKPSQPSAEQTPSKFGFLCCCQQTTEGGYIGGMLITTETGLPLEFRCTSPLKPTAAQRILYGGTLEPHVRANLISDALLKACSNKPEVILTDHESVLALQPEVEIPIVYVRREEGGIQLTSGDGSSPQNQNVVQPLAEGVAAVIVTVHKDSAQLLRDRITVLTSLTESIDLMEPFERVHKALDEVQRQNPG